MIADKVYAAAINFPQFKNLSLDRQGQVCVEIATAVTARPSDAAIHKMVENTLSKLVAATI